MIKVFSYRVKDSGAAGKQLSRMARAVNFVWNYCNEQQKRAVRLRLKWLTGYDLNKLTGGCTKELGVQSHTIQAVGQEYALRRKKARKRWLRWRGWKSLGWIPFKRDGIKMDGDTATYYGHRFRLWLSRPIEGVIKSGNFSQDARGRWYCNLACEVEEKIYCGDGEIGIDLGLKTLAACSNGKKYDAQRYFRQLEWKLAGAQRRKKKRLAKTVHAKIANSRKNYNHKISHELTRDNKLIVIGDISSKKLLRTKMAKSVSDAAWGQLHTFVEYKAIARGGVYRKQNEAFTTQDCSSCFARCGPKGREALGVREWVCCNCVTVHDRDQNAALNILRLGRQALLAEGQ